MGSRCSLPSNALVGGGNDNLFCAGELNFSAPCVPSRSAAGNRHANSSSSALASIKSFVSKPSVNQLLTGASKL